MVTGTLDGLAGLFDLPGLAGFARLVGAVLRMSTTFVDEIVLARCIRGDSDEVWTTARASVVLYAQNAGPILRTAVWLTVMRWLATLVIFVLVVGPAGALVWFVPSGAAAWGLIFALLTSIALQKALIDPFCIAALMQVYFARTEGRIPDPEWEARLDALSAPFRDMASRARAAFGH